MVSIHGRKLYVDYSIDCVCIEFDNFGKKNTLQIPFAKHRRVALLSFGTYGLDTSVPNITLADGTYINGKAFESNKRITTVITDATIQNNLYSGFKAKCKSYSGKYNTDMWMKSVDYTDSMGTTGVPVVQFCRDLTNDGKVLSGYFSLPNLYELAIITVESDNIDDLDPTSTQYPNYKLGYSHTNGRFGSSSKDSNGNRRAWSSNEVECNSKSKVAYITSIGSFAGESASIGIKYNQKNTVIPCAVV